MLKTVLFLIISVAGHSVLHSQTVDWNSAESKGSVTFDNDSITILIVTFEKLSVARYNSELLYNHNLERNQREVKSILDKSGIKYKIVSRSEIEDSTLYNASDYPIIIDHGVRRVPLHDGGETGSVHLYIVDRKSKVKARAKLPATYGKYWTVYKSFVKRINKKKAIKIYLEEASRRLKD